LAWKGNCTLLHNANKDGLIDEARRVSIQAVQDRQGDPAAQLSEPLGLLSVERLYFRGWALAPKMHGRRSIGMREASLKGCYSFGEDRLGQLRIPDGHAAFGGVDWEVGPPDAVDSAGREFGSDDD